MIEREQAVQIAKKLKRETRNPDILALCEWVLTPSLHRQAGGQSYRDYMREYMRQWRAKRREK